MVDAIEGVTTQKINWYKISFKEIQRYKSEGMSDKIPEEVKRWAEEMSKAANVPDTITYDMSMAQTNSSNNDNGNNASGKNMIASLNNASKNSEFTSQGQDLAKQDNTKVSEIDQLTADADKWLQSSENAVVTAQSNYDDTITQIQSLLSAKDNSKDENAKAQAVSQAQDLGSGLQAKLAQNNGEITNSTDNIAEATAIPQAAKPFGELTISVGNSISTFPNSNEHDTIIKAGQDTITAATDGTDKIKATSDVNKEYQASAKDLKDHIKADTGNGKISSKTNSNSKETVKKKVDNDSKGANKRTANNSEQAKFDKSMDKNITNNEPDKIQRKKEHKGEKANVLNP